jgi:hypothetical protein
LVLIDWAIPGLGFALVGRWTRGLAQFLIVWVTFAIGLALHGGVVWPSWSIHAAGFNLINNITFVIQMGAGLPALASLAGGWLGLSWLGGVPQDPFFELGGYYMVVAGALNYFAVCNLYDRVVHPRPRYRESSEGRSPAAS